MLLELDLRVHQSASRIRVAYTVSNLSTRAAYLQNRYGAPRRCPTGMVGGGRSLNDTSDKRAPFSTGSACVWPAKDGTLVVFQGDLVPPSTTSTPSDWSEPAFSLLGEPSTFEIELGDPIHQWENNVTRPASGPTVKVRRLSLSIDVLLDPLVAFEIEGAPGSFACDYGQPGYVEASVDLERPVEIVIEPSLVARAEARLAAMQSLVRLNPWAPRR